MSNQTHRVLELIRRFNNNEKVCIERLQDEYMWEGKSDKTIRRDLDIIKEMFPDTFHRISGEKGCYKAITSELFSNITGADKLSLLIQTFNIAQRSNLFSDMNIDDSDKRILKKKIKESKDTYLFKNKPFENKSADFEIFKKLENAIYHRKELIVDYKASESVATHTVKPYKIIFLNENFYLASEVEHPNYQFTLLRISKIQSLNQTGKSFHQNREISNFIKDMQTPMAKYTANYKANLIEVLVEVDPTRARHFKAKKYLPSQKIVEEKKDGTLVLSYVVTQELEMMDIVKRWIPHMKVISPVALREKIREDIELYLGR